MKTSTTTQELEHLRSDALNKLLLNLNDQVSFWQGLTGISVLVTLSIITFI